MTSKNLEDEAMKQRLLPWTIAASFLLHGVAYASLAPAPAVARPEHRKTQLRFDVVSHEAPKHDEPPPPPKPEPPKPKPQSKAEPKPQAKPEAAPPPPAEPPPVASDGVTL